ncbi:hypothetical protein LVB87_05930 [Lysobacter sp. KIS68-7]|uniref:hypothetical protein n=1 Tax=Lysobacter sp. KIS68-7 TaxID=2904252 RepID=UPI001E5A7EE2|nr:hypothetical protein [Lysobacter sp. KIS68-7]UHQ20681.1 hypothetical protein LVB87_05930 [Lysobacter sp. KIS68-7]
MTDGDHSDFGDAESRGPFQYACKPDEPTFASYRDTLVATFRHSTPLMRRLLLSPKLKRLEILVGSPVNGMSLGVKDADGKDVYLVAANVAAFGVDAKHGYETYQAYYESFQTLAGGGEHRNKTLIAQHRYAPMPKGPEVHVTLRPGADESLRGPVGVLLKILHHELGHFLQSYATPAAIGLPGAGEDDDTWRDPSIPALIFDAAPKNGHNGDFAFASSRVEAARTRTCFGREPVCGTQRHAAGDPGFAADLQALYGGTGVLDSVASWKPDEAFCEWQAFLALEPEMQSIVIEPAPGVAHASIDVIAEMRSFKKRKQVLAFLEERGKVLEAALAAP